jgi:hypothetical protein
MSQKQWKISAICIHFCRLIACEMSDKIINSDINSEFKCLTNCLLPQSIFLKIVCSMPEVWKNTPFLTNNSLTRIQIFHRLSEAYCLHNRMEKYACFVLDNRIVLRHWKFTHTILGQYTDLQQTNWLTTLFSANYHLKLRNILFSDN